jgi:hypothetical protein
MYVDIYIGNLPNQLTPAELKKIVNAVLLPTNFKELIRRLVNKKSRITHSEFDVVGNQIGDDAACFAHAVIKPDRIARRVLRRLDHFTLQGNSLRAREYVSRSRANERRSQQCKNLYAVKAYNRRIRDRRS